MTVLRVIALVIALLLSAAGTAAAIPATERAATGAGATSCVATPEEFASAWSSRFAACVDPGLLGTVHARGADRPYPRGFARAWAVGHRGLEDFLAVNARLDRGRAGLAILTLVGFPRLDRWDTPVSLAVYRLADGAGARTPTWSTVFDLLRGQRQHRGLFPAAARRDLIRAYAVLDDTAASDVDAVTALERVTGCSRSQVLAGRHFTQDIGCSASFVGALKVLGRSPYNGGTTRGCLARFARDYAGPRDAAALRAVLLRCLDADVLFTGTGWTYTTYANPLLCGSATQQGVQRRYTARERIVPNVAFDRMPFVVDIPLSLSPVSQRGFLQSGYC